MKKILEKSVLDSKKDDIYQIHKDLKTPKKDMPAKKL